MVPKMESKLVKIGRAGPGRRALAKHGFVSRLPVFSRGRGNGKTGKIEKKKVQKRGDGRGPEKIGPPIPICIEFGDLGLHFGLDFGTFSALEGEK